MPKFTERRLLLAVSTALAMFGVIAALWLVLLAPRFLAAGPTDALLRKIKDPVAREQVVNDRLSAQNDIRGTILQGLGGAIVLLGLYLTFRQYQLNQEGHITDRFTHAIDQLGSESIAVRVGGIAALGRIARDSARDHEPVMECLAAFVREQSAGLNRSNAGQIEDKPAHLRGDIQAAAAVLGARPENRRSDESRRISLRGAALARAHLRNAHYEGMALTNADFRRGQLSGIHFNEALLRSARFYKAVLEGAHLNGTFLVDADLRYARMARSNLEGAWLFGANLEGAHIDGVRLGEACYAIDLGLRGSSQRLIQCLTW